ncbi:MAG: hypothetical protein AABY40_00520 [Nanoarchaeota archaeon]
MLQEALRQLKDKISAFSPQDQIIFNNRLIEISKAHFLPITTDSSSKSFSPSIAFVDGGQAEIISAGNFCLSFIRVAALVYSNNQKIKEYKDEFYLLTTAKYEKDDIFYESKTFPSAGKTLIDENDLQISSTDVSIRLGMERAAITSVASVARRFAELSLCGKISADIIVLDGILKPSYRNEEKYLSLLPAKVCALAKSSSLFTVSGNSPLVLLNKLSSLPLWSYSIDDANFFVKLHPRSKHVFRFTGNRDYLPHLAENSKDAIFLGYPYGLISADRSARVSNEEKNSLRMNILLKAENKEIMEYLSATNAHDILDSLG